ncbi:MAG: hypothetical protein Q8P24_20310 [Desulfobacterales bacterium]|nr:hypothetical protein [Desulfobacterales bacterium]
MKVISCFALVMALSLCSCGQEKASLRYDGLYLAKGNDTTRYLRFYEDGTVIGVGVANPSTPDKIAKWLYKDNPDELWGKDTYKVKGSDLEFTLKSPPGEVDYKGRIEKDVLSLALHSRINDRKFEEKYEFVSIELPPPVASPAVRWRDRPEEKRTADRILCKLSYVCKHMINSSTLAAGMEAFLKSKAYTELRSEYGRDLMRGAFDKAAEAASAAPAVKGRLIAEVHLTILRICTHYQIRGYGEKDIVSVPFDKFMKTILDLAEDGGKDWPQ